MTITSARLVASLLVAVVAATTASAQSGNPRSAAPAAGRRAAATPAAVVPRAQDYRLGAGDKLRIEVYKDQQLSQSLQVRPDGKITLPLVGDLVATGLTPIELRDRVTDELKEYVTNPVVTVIVVEANAAVAYVMGEVSHPGSIPIAGPTTVLEALARAGGFREWANTKSIRVLRRPDPGKAAEIIKFNYKDALKGKGPEVFLRPGDMVIVP